MYNLVKFLENINSRTSSANPFKGSFGFDEPMANHTSFKVGGPADVWIRPEGECFPEYAALLLESARNEGIPVFILGCGANIVVSDKGIRGIVLDTTGYTGIAETWLPFLHKRRHGESVISEQGTKLCACAIRMMAMPLCELLCFRAGTAVEAAAEIAADRCLSGLEFLAGMPGSIGGALWMNARCYDREIADVVREVLVLEKGSVIQYTPKKEDFSYKKSPFQKKDSLILTASFALQAKDAVIIKKEMEEHKKDRDAKGHYRFPSAGSVFKNNRSFGRSTGKIIDDLGLKGLSIGDAQIAPWHGNIIINRGTASSAEILSLVTLVEKRVKAELGLELEREIIFV